MPFTTLASCALPIVKALDQYDIDGRDLMQRAGLDPGLLQDANARYPFAAMTRLWTMATAASRDPAFGLSTAAYWHPTTLHALGFTWLASTTLREALGRLSRYTRVVSNSLMLRIEEQNDEVVLQVDSLSRRNLSMADAAVDAVAAVVVHMCRLSAGTGFTPQRLLFGHAAPPDSRPFEDYFRAPVTFAAAHHELELIFAADPLTAPLPTGNAALAMANEQIVIDYLARFDRSDMSLQVRAKLIEQLPDGIVDQSRIATALNTSLRNLQRQLQREGMSFRQLLDQTRHDLALGYLSDSALMLNEIAYLLGFSEPANFTRAFRRWTGRTPSEHREAG